MAQQPVTIQAGNYMQRDLQVSEDADFIWPLALYDGEPPNEDAAVLTGRTFKFEVFGLDGVSLADYEIGTGITVASNVVTVTIELEDWADWRKNCDLKYEFLMTLDTGIRYPLFKGKFRITT